MTTFLTLTIAGLLLIVVPFFTIGDLVKKDHPFLGSLMIFLIPIGQILFKLGVFYGITYFIFHCFGLLETCPAIYVWGIVGVEMLLSAIVTSGRSEK